MVELTTNQKGAIAEAVVAKAAAELGVIVARPIQDTAYDLLPDLPTGFMRLQCKWAVRKGSVVLVYCRRCRRGPEGLIRKSYELGEIDAIAGHCADTDRCYLLPLSMSVNRTAVQLRLDPPRNNQRALINWAKDYEFGARVLSSGP
jgi:hypothetical protein